MDKLDKLSLLAIIILGVSASFLVAVSANDTQDQDKYVVRQQVRVFNPELDKKVSAARSRPEEATSEEAVREDANSQEAEGEDGGRDPGL